MISFSCVVKTAHSARLNHYLAIAAANIRRKNSICLLTRFFIHYKVNRHDRHETQSLSTVPRNPLIVRPSRTSVRSSPKIKATESNKKVFL